MDNLEVSKKEKEKTNKQKNGQTDFIIKTCTRYNNDLYLSVFVCYVATKNYLETNTLQLKPEQ